MKFILLIPLASLFYLAISCGGGGGGSGGNDNAPQVVADPTLVEKRKSVLESITNNVVLPTYSSFVTASENLVTATEAYSADTSDNDLKEATKGAWRDAMILWQKAELLKFGPGDDKSEDIYSWPLVEPCTSDTATLNQDYLNDDFINKNTIKRITGLDSLERLLFSENTDSECETDHETANNWSSITNLNDRRLAYAVVLAKDVRDRALALHDEWKPDAQNFALKFTSAGEGSTSDYSSALEALNDAFAGMFYLDKKTKDRKMGVPIGLIPKSKGAVAIKDSSYIESVYANHSKENLIHNIVGFEMLFLGGTESDYGFDDLLTDLGTEGATLATRMKTNITSAKTALNNITGTLKAAIDDNANTKDDEAYAAVKAITDDLKNGFVSLLGLRVPEEGESDVD